ncbi:MAG: peptide chain release factor 1 [Verrucomicrobiota bacterium]|jgi:peptide chain release factor 1
MDLLQRLASRIGQMESRHRQVEALLSSPEAIGSRQQFSELTREHLRLGQALNTHARLLQARQDLAQAREMASSDPEMAEMARDEIAALEEEIPQLESRLKTFVAPPDPADSRDCIIEIRPAAGGDEAGLFAEEMSRMYMNYAAAKGWRCEVLEHSASDLGGLKSIAFSVKGQDVFKEMGMESGVHRVQRVPTTETQGRIHTSTVTVAVLPEAEEIDVKLDPDDLKIETTRSSGAGGQHVNKTDSAVRITHIPTGTVVFCQAGRSQHSNKDLAMQILRSRLLEQRILAERARLSHARLDQIGSGERSERIRTYNFPQSRCTDHRYGITRHDLGAIVSGSLGPLLEQILAIEAERRLEAELGQPGIS